jgi:hypothetical protein
MVAGSAWAKPVNRLNRRTIMAIKGVRFILALLLRVVFTCLIIRQDVKAAELVE